MITKNSSRILQNDFNYHKSQTMMMVRLTPPSPSSVAHYIRIHRLSALAGSANIKQVHLVVGG